MGAGIAVTFCNHFPDLRKRVESEANVKASLIAIHYEEHSCWVYNLVTNHYDLPTREDFHERLVLMREHASVKQVLEIHIPRLGAGLDRLNWEDSKQRILTVFKNQNLRLSVYVHLFPTVGRSKTSGKVKKPLTDDEETLPYRMEERLSGHDLIHDEQDNLTAGSNVAVSGSIHHVAYSPPGKMSGLCARGPPSDRISSG